MYLRRLLKSGSFVSSFDKLLHTSVFNRSVFVKDVYKVLNYEAPFAPQEKEKVLKVINSSTEEEISDYTTKVVSKNIIRHRLISGNFFRIEQLLDVEKFSPKTLEKLCNKILDEDSGDNSTEDNKSLLSEALDIKKLKVMFEKDVKPRVKVKDYSDGEKSIIGVKISLHALSFANIDKNQTLESWGIIPAIENTTSQASFVHDKLFAKAREVVSRIPVGDYYILEDVIPVMPKDSHNIIKYKMHLVAFRTSIITQLLLRSKLQASVHTLKLSVLEKLFDLKIGTDRKSMAEHLKQIVGHNEQNEEHHDHVVGYYRQEEDLNQVEERENSFYTEISDELWTEFFTVTGSKEGEYGEEEEEEEEVMGRNNLDKEMIANSLLLSVAFNSLTVAAEKGLFKKEK